MPTKTNILLTASVKALQEFLQSENTNLFHNIHLAIFDMDDTLLKQNEQIPVNGVEHALDNLALLGTLTSCAIATNQGGVSVRIDMQERQHLAPEKYQNYPTMVQAQLRVAGAQTLLQKHLHIEPSSYISYAFQNSKNGRWTDLPSIAYDQFGQVLPEWQQSWRKPNAGMLLQAMEDDHVSPEQTLMIGDREEDSLAAERAGVRFLHINDFIAWGS